MQNLLFLRAKFYVKFFLFSDLSFIFNVKRVSLIKLVSCIFSFQILIQLLVSNSFNFFFRSERF